jgi:hypothetical protein
MQQRDGRFFRFGESAVDQQESVATEDVTAVQQRQHADLVVFIRGGFHVRSWSTTA